MKEKFKQTPKDTRLKVNVQKIKRKKKNGTRDKRFKT